MDQTLDTKAKSTWSPSCIIASDTTEDPDGFRNFLRVTPEVLLGTVHLSLEAFSILFTSFVFVSSTRAC